jgi:hypothetical protein
MHKTSEIGRGKQMRDYFSKQPLLLLDGDDDEEALRSRTLREQLNQ